MDYEDLLYLDCDGTPECPIDECPECEGLVEDWACVNPSCVYSDSSSLACRVAEDEAEEEEY